jgi:hypothetical protein
VFCKRICTIALYEGIGDWTFPNVHSKNMHDESEDIDTSSSPLTHGIQKSCSSEHHAVAASHKGRKVIPQEQAPRRAKSEKTRMSVDSRESTTIRRAPEAHIDRVRANIFADWEANTRDRARRSTESGVSMSLVSGKKKSKDVKELIERHNSMWSFFSRQRKDTSKTDSLAGMRNSAHPYVDTE